MLTNMTTGEWGVLRDFDTGEIVRWATAVEASCWQNLQRSGISMMFVDRDEAVARHTECEVAVVWSQR